MAFVKVIEHLEQGSPTAILGWEQAERLIRRLSEADPPDLTMKGEEEALMIVSYAKPEGYYVVARQSNELGESLLVDKRKSDEIVSALIGGCRDSWPAFAFVDESIALEAAYEFYLTGRRSENLSWIDPGEVIAKYEL